MSPDGALCILRVPGRYIGQVRPTRARRWRTVTGRCRTAEAALAKALLRKGTARWARALWVDAGEGWYEPHVAMEIR